MPAWSPKDVETWMVHAERADPRVRNPGEARPLSWPDRYVADKAVRRIVKLWVWCEANGFAFHDICRRRGIPYTTALRRKNAAVERIVMLLNLEESLAARENLITHETVSFPIDSG